MSTRILQLGPVLAPFFRETRPPLPPRDVLSLDDEQVKSIALHLGVPLGVRTGKESKGGPHFNAIFKDTQTHWLIFGEYMGHKKPQDNGYILGGWTKANRTIEEAQKSVEQFLDYHMRGERHFTEIKPWQS